MADQTQFVCPNCGSTDFTITVTHYETYSGSVEGHLVADFESESGTSFDNESMLMPDGSFRDIGWEPDEDTNDAIVNSNAPLYLVDEDNDTITYVYVSYDDCEDEVGEVSCSRCGRVVQNPIYNDFEVETC